jgi:glycosyltransferase involved in cell wall biosynthesis
MKSKIVHIINSLEFGGAEMMLANLLARSDRGRFDPVVVLLIADLTLADRIERLGVPIRVVGMKPGIPDPRGILSLVRLLRQEKPRLVQTWMDHSNLIGGIATRLAGPTPLVWGIHHSNHVPGYTKRSTLWTVAACARLSRSVPTRVVCCSEHARATYERRGFAPAKMTVIPNGFDTDAYRPDPSARLAVRRELGVEPETPLIGLVARFDPLKDHLNFLRAGGLLKDRHPEAHLLLCGEGVDGGNRVLTETVESLGLVGRCHLLGPRRDIPRIQASLDIAASSSFSEAFPLAVGEAMACGTPCVVTDVGDSALMVGETGRVVPARDHAALAGALGDVLDLPPTERRAMGDAARRRTLELFDLSAVTKRYEDVYRSLLTPEGQSETPELVGAGPAPERVASAH